MRQKLRGIPVILLLLCMLTGCGRAEQGSVDKAHGEKIQVWIEAGYAENNANKAIENADEAISSANEAIESARQALAETEPPKQAEVINVPESTPVLAPQPSPTAVPEPTTYEFTQSDKEYFSDALFIGDSRTVGLQMYGTLDNADYFATPGLSVYSLPRTKISIDEYEDITMTELLEKKDYKKVYLMLGINELGYNFEKTLTKYKELVTQLQTMEPEAILYVCANLHVTGTRDENDEIHNNESINRINAEIATLADQKNVFYLDVNVLFDDEEGNLDEEYASDDSHVLGVYYNEWCNWLLQNTIVK